MYDFVLTRPPRIGIHIANAASRGLLEDGVSDPDFDYDEHDCANCGGEGFVYGCSWDWQCDTYDEGEGTCLCTRPCDWCQPRPRNPELESTLSAVFKEVK